MGMGTVTVTYDDGHTDSVELRPGLLIQAERHFKGDPPRIEGTLFCAWLGLGRPGGKFDFWVESIAAMSEERDTTEVDPTDEGPGDEPSPS